MCDIVCFQETKVSSCDVAFVQSLWSSPFIDWVVLDVVQTSGGVLLIWNKRVFEKLDVMVGQFSVSVLLRGVVDARMHRRGSQAGAPAFDTAGRGDAGGTPQTARRAASRHVADPGSGRRG